MPTTEEIPAKIERRKYRQYIAQTIWPYLAIFMAALAVLKFIGGQYASVFSVLLAYFSVSAGCLGASTLAMRKYPKYKIHIKIAGYVLTVLAVTTYGYCDYRIEKFEKYGNRYWDKYSRWTNKHFYRYVHLKNGGSAKGPVAGTPEHGYIKQHGKWETFVPSPRDENGNRYYPDWYRPVVYEWFWYGERITEAQWLDKSQKTYTIKIN